VPPGSLLVNERVEKLRDLGFVATPATNPANGAPCSWIAADNPTDERLKGLYTWDACEYLVLALSALLRGKAAHFIGVGEARAMLERLASAFPHLVQETVPVPVSDFTFADVLRRLVAEEASIRNLPRILMALADWGRVERDPLFLTEYVRAGLQRQITYRASRGTNSIVVLLLDPEIERSIAEATRHTATGSYVALAPERVRAIVNAIARPVAADPARRAVAVPPHASGDPLVAAPARRPNDAAARGRLIRRASGGHHHSAGGTHRARSLRGPRGVCGRIAGVVNVTPETTESGQVEI
jgi:type III secretion protein V